MKLGVCYYPEHWPETDWALDIQAMQELGLKHVRIGEFAWSQIEPEDGVFDWGWLDRIIDALHAADLEITMCTPTATPPKWLVDKYPGILPVDAHGQVRKFGSRRHYCFSSQTYLAESARITELIARRYGQHPGITMWQTDNEYGHHDTDESFSEAAQQAFRAWLKAKYNTIDALNQAWGTAFWSQSYQTFEAVDPPAATVTEANPSQRLDWRRFCSHQICAFNRAQTEIIRQHSPGRPISHNFIGDFTRLDHRAISRDLDIAAWDSYPIGLLSEGHDSLEEKAHWLRSGHPDFAAFNHDVFRACAPRWGVMEQQPGPVNWATYNAAPAPGMVRLWTWEAFAHGADFVSYFRWRQLPFGQEQMHAGLLAPDRTPQPVIEEIQTFIREQRQTGSLKSAKAQIALLLDYPSLWQSEIQPQGNPNGSLDPARAIYSACRQLGLNIDVVFQDSDLSGYKLGLIPSATLLGKDFCDRLAASDAEILFTPLSGARSRDGHLSDPQDGPVYRHMQQRLERLETLPPHIHQDILHKERTYFGYRWRETITTDAETHASFSDGDPAWVRRGNLHYLACWPDAEFLKTILRDLCDRQGITHAASHADLRLRQTATLQFAFNYGPSQIDLGAINAPSDSGAYRLGGPMLKPYDVAAWKRA